MEKEKIEKAAEKVFQLSDGRSCKVIALKGRDMVQAQRVADGDQAKIMFALTAMATTIDEKQIVVEELEDMSLSDALKIQNAFGEINFF